MSTYGIATLRTVNGDAGMEIVGIHGHQENGPGGCSNSPNPKGIEEEHQTPPATAVMASVTPTPPNVDADNIRCANGEYVRDTIKSKKLAKRLRNGSGCGDQEGYHYDDVNCKKRKTRRGRPKHRKLKPYTKQQSYQERQRSRTIGRLITKSTQPPAPYNTTQFLMEDHSDLPDLEEKLAKTTTNPEIQTTHWQKAGSGHPRTRDSSFSIDSDDEYFYSSPEDEEEFLTKEFSSAYEDLHAERLSALSKSELIQEYVQLEAKLDLLTKRMRSKTLQAEDIESKSNNEMTKKLKMYQQRIDDLMQQNEQLRRENESLRGKRRHSESSVDSESDSDSSSSNSNPNRSPCSVPDSSTSPVIKKMKADSVNRRTMSQEIDGLPT